MMLIKKYLTIVSVFVVPSLVFAQVHERGMMKNRTNVEKESSSYTLGILKDTSQYRQKLIEFADYDDYDDDAALEETDIIYETFSNDVIHYLKKFDYTNLKGSIAIRLTDEKNKKYFAFPVEGQLTSHFGPRWNRFHYGTDIGMRTGTPIKAMFDGVVRYAKYCSGYGNIVVVRHDNGLETYYGHMSKITAKPNQKVKAGEIIGLVGSTGRSTGPHLHLEIRYLGAAINPEHVINFEDFSLKAENEVIYLTREDFKPAGSTSKYQRSNSRYSKNANRSLAKNKSSRSGKSVTVRKGETLSQIAKRNGTTVKKLCQMNGIKGNKIKAGQKLKVR